ncbi:MAG: ATP-binding protein [Treponema sp.]|nr:ATP-binding protein [Treponema sp.]
MLPAACDLKLFNNIGAILENLVFIHLRKQNSDIHYYKTKNGYEIDFVTGTEENLNMYQVCADLSDEDTRKRELRAIKEACTELKCTNATVITLREEEMISLEKCKVNVVKAVDWVLS